jgi:hypothetical protein
MQAFFRLFKIQFIVGALLCAAAPAAMAQTHSTGVFRVQLSLPAAMVVTGTGANYDTITRMTLNDADIVNLVFGRPLTTKVNAKTEVLAAAVSFQATNSAPLSQQLIIYDTTQNGQAGVRVVVATLQTLQWQNAYENVVNSGLGIATGVINATTNGTPALDGFLASPFEAAGSALGEHLFNVGDAHASPVASISIHAQLNFVYTNTKGTHKFNGFVVAGTGSLSGHPIGGW